MRKRCLYLAFLSFILLALFGAGLTVDVGHVQAKSRTFTVHKAPLSQSCQFDMATHSCNGLNPATTYSYNNGGLCTSTQKDENDKNVYDSKGVKAGLLRFYFSSICGAVWAAFAEDCSYTHNISYLRTAQLSSDDSEPTSLGPGYQTVTPCHWASPDAMLGVECFSDETFESIHVGGSFHDYLGVIIVTNSTTFDQCNGPYL